jgi:hypothetical protein
MEHVTCNAEMKNVYKILVVKPEGKRVHGRPKRRWMIILKLVLEKLDFM